MYDFTNVSTFARNRQFSLPCCLHRALDGLFPLLQLELVRRIQMDLLVSGIDD